MGYHLYVRCKSRPGFLYNPRAYRIRVLSSSLDVGQDFVRGPLNFFSYDHSRFPDHPRWTVKETWEPTIEDLFTSDHGKTRGWSLIQEAWGLDCQNHGETCTLNEDILARNPGISSTSIAVHAFLDPRLISRFTSNLGLCRRVYDALQPRTSRIHRS